MTPQERWLALTLAAGPGGLRGLRAALAAFGTPEAVLAAGAAALEARCALPAELARRLASAADSPAFRIESRLVTEHGVRLLPWDDPAYPAALRDLASAPLLLYVKGTWPAAGASNGPASGPASRPASGPIAGPSAGPATTASIPPGSEAVAGAPARAPSAAAAALGTAAASAANPAAGTTPGPRLALAVVGTRRPSRYGEQFTRTLIAALARAEPRLTVISGLARGIDGIAHEAALDAGLTTLAVMAGGLSRVYPPEHEPLAARVQQQGALLTEFPMITAPLARNFPVRNRIIAALARAVLIVEAGEQSGSLITAGCAQTYGRTLLALPGNADQPESVGTNRLIQSGQARLVLNAGDVLAGVTGRPPQPLTKGPRVPARKLLRPPGHKSGGHRAAGHRTASHPAAGHRTLTGAGAPGPSAAFGHAATGASGSAPATPPDGPGGRILGALRDGPLHPDDLAQAAGLAIEQALGLLLELELSGEIVQTSEHTYALP